jgi:hypothetical protein
MKADTELCAQLFRFSEAMARKHVALRLATVESGALADCC